LSDEMESRHDDLPDFVAADLGYSGGCAGGVCEF